MKTNQRNRLKINDTLKISGDMKNTFIHSNNYSLNSYCMKHFYFFDNSRLCGFILINNLI
jgi:hypothetical protein